MMELMHNEGGIIKKVVSDGDIYNEGNINE